ncbi:MAG TPA: hypothetical protein IAC91_10640 [Candidatus Faecimorpha stercoravium]|nr:hypothetical protein [Candidatus Faecimorpha stercoravium]
MPEKTDHSDWLFKWVPPMQAMRACMIMVFIFVCIALASAVGWFFSRTANSTISYDYRATTIEEYLQTNGTSVLSYDPETNEIAFMMTEDLINSVIHQWLGSQDWMLNGHRVYEIVYRQEESMFHVQLQAGIFRVPMQAEVRASWDEESEELVLDFYNARLGEDTSFWASWVNAPRLPSLRIPVSELGLPEWQSIVGIELNRNEMLLYLQPDLEMLARQATGNVQVDSVYLDWQNSLADSPELVRRLGEIAAGDAIETQDVCDFLEVVIDHQDQLIPLLAVSDQGTVAEFIERYDDYLTNDVTMEACQSRRDNIRANVMVQVARQLLQSLDAYIEQGIGTTPPALEQPEGSVDNSYVEFTDGARLEGTAVVVQVSSDSSGAGTDWDPNRTFFLDAGTIYDYHTMEFVTTERMAELFPVTTPHVDFLDQIRFYYVQETGEAVAIVSGQTEGEVQVLMSKGSRTMTAEEAEAAYPGYTKDPETASVPAEDSEVRSAIVTTLQEELGEGAVLTRYMAASSNSAFVVFSTATHMERVRSAVLYYDQDTWTVQGYDVSNYLEYCYLHPEINGTIFPAETIQKLEVRTIPAKGLNLLLEKALQVNLVSEGQSIDYYYYIGSYIYVHFTNDRQCVFQVNDQEEIIACRSVESAEANWNLPPFFILEDSRQA